jgi:hypothetical protein
MEAAVDGVVICSNGVLSLGVLITAGFVRFVVLLGVVITGSVTAVDAQHPITVSRTWKMSMLLLLSVDLL